MSKIQISEIRVMPYTVASAEINMALDRHLLELPGTFLRLYGWSEPTLSFGRMNRGVAEIDREFCRRRGIRMVRRLSGGKTVLHDRELTYAFVSDNDLFPDSVVDTYRMISSILADSFQQFGLQPEMNAEKGPEVDSSICFRETSSYELTVGGKKLVGSAQYRKRKRFFQHGSILLEIDWPTWKTVWGFPPDSMELEQRITCFQDQLGCSPSPEKLAAVIVAEFGRCFNAKITEWQPDDQAWQEVEALSLKYRWQD